MNRPTDGICNMVALTMIWTVTSLNKAGFIKVRTSHQSRCSHCSEMFKIFSVRTVRCSCYLLVNRCSSCSVFGLFAQNELFGLSANTCTDRCSVNPGIKLTYPFLFFFLLFLFRSFRFIECSFAWKWSSRNRSVFTIWSIFPFSIQCHRIMT